MCICLVPVEKFGTLRPYPGRNLISWSRKSCIIQINPESALKVMKKEISDMLFLIRRQLILPATGWQQIITTDMAFILLFYSEWQRKYLLTLPTKGNLNLLRFYTTTC
jgi:hypothetical protein